MVELTVAKMRCRVVSLKRLNETVTEGGDLYKAQKDLLDVSISTISCLYGEFLLV
jgi:hypothetical protein